MSEKPTPEDLAIKLRVALKELRSFTDNLSFYDDEHKVSFKFDEVEAMLDEHFPAWNAYQRAFLDALSHNGIDNGGEFLRCQKNGTHYTAIENGAVIFDHWVSFDAGARFARANPET